MDGSSLGLPDQRTLRLNQPVAFEIQFDRDLISETNKKLELARYPVEQADYDEANWGQGAKITKVKALAAHWRYKYDYEKQEKDLNSIFNHFLSSVKGAIPLLISHGWPGSFVEAKKVVGPLSEPESPAYTGVSRGRTLYSWLWFLPSFRPVGVGPEVTARAFKTLMTDVLGYPRFVTQGGDFGAFITRSMAIQYPDVVVAQHLNMFPVPEPTVWKAPMAYLRWCFSSLCYTDFEKEALRVRQNFEMDQSGYLEQQRTRAQTLGYALGDSPVGLLAWFVEKFHDWVDVTEAFDPDTIITLVMMHWIQGATPGLRFYQEAFGKRREAEKAFATYVKSATGVSMYAKEQLHCPKDWAQQAANIQFWREYDVESHFSSLECPKLFVKDMRELFSKEIRKALKS